MADWVLLLYIMQFNRQNIYTWAVMGSILPKMKRLNILQEVDFPTTQHLISKHHPTSLDLEMPWVIRFCDYGVRSNTMRQIGEELKRFTEHRTTKPHSRWASGSRELH